VVNPVLNIPRGGASHITLVPSVCPIYIPFYMTTTGLNKTHKWTLSWASPPCDTDGLSWLLNLADPNGGPLQSTVVSPQQVQ